MSRDTYGEPRVLYFPGVVAKVYRPILTPDERERRMKRIYDSAARLLRGGDKHVQNG